MLSAKITQDDTYSNKSWTIVANGGGMDWDLNEINQMERELFGFLKWRVVVREEEIADWERGCRLAWEEECASEEMDVETIVVDGDISYGVEEIKQSERRSSDEKEMNWDSLWEKIDRRLNGPNDSGHRTNETSPTQASSSKSSFSRTNSSSSDSSSYSYLSTPVESPTLSSGGSSPFSPKTPLTPIESRMGSFEESTARKLSNINEKSLNRRIFGSFRIPSSISHRTSY
jgi:hypothetical protein